MFKIDQDKTINLTRGDAAEFVVKIKIDDTSYYQFQPGDKISFAIYDKSNYTSLKFKKEVTASETTQELTISLTSADTKLDDIINKPKDYWYEIQLNEEQTIIGYDEDGAKIFRLYPEGE